MIELVKDCAVSIYDKTKPNDQYADRTVRLLLGTAATESFFKYRRQTVFDLVTDKGAWGLWQTEKGSVEDNLKFLASRPELRKRVANFLVGHDSIDGILCLGPSEVLRLVHDWDNLAVVMCRLHYFRKKPPIPETLQEQGEYYKIHYNTLAGKGSVEKYIRDWNAYVKGKLYD